MRKEVVSQKCEYEILIIDKEIITALSLKTN